jgi:uncharacterized protein with GYD domain
MQLLRYEFPRRHFVGISLNTGNGTAPLLFSRCKLLTPAAFAVINRSVSKLAGKEKGGKLMPTYVTLINWTDQGIRNVRDTLQRSQRAEEEAQKHGARIEQVYYTVGPYDLVVIVEAPDDESVSALFLELGSAGNVRTTTLRAYSREEMSGIIERLGPPAST